MSGVGPKRRTGLIDDHQRRERGCNIDGQRTFGSSPASYLFYVINRSTPRMTDRITARLVMHDPARGG